MPPSPGIGRSVPLLLLIGVGAAIGVAAVLLVGPTPRLPAPPPSGGELRILLPTWATILLAFSPVLFAFVGLYLQGRSQGRWRTPALNVVIVLLCFLVLLAALGAAHNGSGLGGGGSVSVITSPSNPPTNNSTGGNGTALGNGAPGTYWQIPAWGVWVGVGFVAALCVGVGWGIFARRPVVPPVASRPPATADRESRAALGEAAGALELGADPRTVVLRLYARLLARVGPGAGDLGPFTPEEIRVGTLAQMGLSGPATHDLTRLFEEARYSSHPMGPDAAARGVRAIRLIEQQIAVRAVAS